MMGLQKSQFSDRQSLQFTANITVVRKDVWAGLRESKPHFPERPAPNTHYGTAVWQARIGNLLPAGEDKWWRVTNEVDAATAVGELAAAIEDYVLPEMQTRLST
jgi:hypothetical protein